MQIWMINNIKQNKAEMMMGKEALSAVEKDAGRQ